MTPAVAEKLLTLAIAGNPNSGKSTLFNRLTGLRQKVANYPGVTVERKEGEYSARGVRVRVLDLPGTYALTPQSEEQRIAADILLGRHPGSPALDGVLVVLDSTCLEKSLYLVLQVRETGVPMAVVLNMADELAVRGAVIDARILARLLEVPVVPISATKGTGMDELESVIDRWPEITHRRIGHPAALSASTLEAARTWRRQAKQLARAAIVTEIQPHPWSDMVDRVVLHRVWGPLLFSVVVLFVFQSIFTWAQPLMNGIDKGFTMLADAIRSAYPGSLPASFIADGMVAGVGSVVTFLPQILIVFFFIAVLENSGYLARAALVMDKVMSKIGLQGRSFLPLMSSYACAVPGIMATRTIENKRDRLATIFIAPFMTCSARLPVYALLIGAFVPDEPVLGRLLGLRAATLLGLYLIGFCAALVTARLLKSSILKSDRRQFFMEMPPYRIPQVKSVLLMLWDRARIFLRRAGTIILAVSLLMWVLASFPRAEGKTDIRASFAGQIGTLMEPVIRPLGFNWRIGVGLVSAQVAREVMVSTLSTTYRVTHKGEDTESLQLALRQDMTPLTAVSLMVFFALAMQCMSTLAVVRRETGGWKIPALMFLYMNVLAYLASLVIYQGGRWLGWS